MTDNIDPTEHQKLAHAICARYRKWQSAGFSYEDLFQEAMIGLVKAARAYDPAKGAWTTYACKVAGGHVRRHIARTIRAVHVPEYIQSRYSDPSMVKARVAAGRRKGPRPDLSIEPIIPEGVPVKKLEPAPYPDAWLPVPHDPQHPCHSTGNEFSLDLPSTEDSEDDLHDLVSGFNELHEARTDVEDIIEARERATILRKLVDALPARERAIMLGLLAGERKVDLAKDHGVTATRIGQIAEKLSKQFREFIEKEPE